MQFKRKPEKVLKTIVPKEFWFGMGKCPIEDCCLKHPFFVLAYFDRGKTKKIAIEIDEDDWGDWMEAMLDLDAKMRENRKDDDDSLPETQQLLE